MSDHSQLLRIFYRELPISRSLKRAINIQKCETLESLLNKKGSELLATRGFGEKNLKELYNFLRANKLEYLLI